MKNGSEPNISMYENVRDRTEIFDFMIKTALDGFWYWDLENRENDWVNDRFWEVLGYDQNSEESKTLTWKEVIFPEDKQIILNGFDIHCQDSNTPLDEIVRYRHHNGTTVWLRCKGQVLKNNDGKPIQMLISHFDVTTEKVKESYLNSCNKAARIGYWEVDLQGSSVYWSPITKNIHDVPSDYKPDLDTAINFYKEGEYRDAVSKVFGDAINQGKEYNVETILITATGSERWVNAIGFPQMDNGKCVRIYGTFQDIDERKRIELEMISLLNISNNQNKRLRHFKNIVSHNLRSHSGNIEFLIDLLAQDISEVNEFETFKMLQRASNNLVSTIQHLNDVAKITEEGKSQMETLQLNDFVSKAVSSVSGLAQDSKVEIINKVGNDEKIEGVPAFLESIILNFLTNSIKYRSTDRESYVKLFTSKQGPQISLHIEDNGLGIDLERNEDKLFGMYKTFHNHPDSRGIGLFITKKQIDAINATINVSSVVDKGTTFKINFAYEKD